MMKRKMMVLRWEEVRGDGERDKGYDVLGDGGRLWCILEF